MAFQYQPLKPNEIRLLKPLKPLSRAPAELSVQIIHVSLFSKPSYAALSYKWGPPDNRYGVLLSGQYFPIRENLHQALQQIQASKLLGQHLWVDAICIDQGDDGKALSERSFQVTLMTQIYGQASKILVWLGNPVNEAQNRLASTMMRDLENRSNKVLKKGRPYRPWWLPHKTRTTGQDVADIMLELSPLKDKMVFDVPGSQAYKAWVGIASMWASPWFQRTWVLQEATIPEPWTSLVIMGLVMIPATSKVKFLYGDQQATWNQFQIATLVAVEIDATPGFDAEFLRVPRTNVEKISKLRYQRVRDTMPSFLDLLQMFRYTECTDPRDKVYA